MFSYDEYREILSIIKQSNRGMKFREAIDKDEFIVMRHDVEFSVDRAYRLSLVESEMDFTSTWFFQWTNNNYNILSRRSMDKIKDMHERGHIIGLHYALNGLTDVDLSKKQILKEMSILSEMFGYEINEFSIHRPPEFMLEANIKLPNIINAYQDDFFTFDTTANENSKLDVKYMSDAMHTWRFGYPNYENIMNNKKVQILVHPFSWCEHGYNNRDNYAYMIKEKYQEMIDSIDAECKDFKEYRELFERATLVD